MPKASAEPKAKERMGTWINKQAKYSIPSDHFGHLIIPFAPKRWQCTGKCRHPNDQWNKISLALILEHLINSWLCFQTNKREFGSKLCSNIGCLHNMNIWSILLHLRILVILTLPPLCPQATKRQNIQVFSQYWLYIEHSTSFDHLQIRDVCNKIITMGDHVCD